jgi:transposase
MRKKPHTSQTKFKVALECIKAEKTIEQIQEYGVLSSQIYKWRKELIEHGADVFSNKREPSIDSDVDLDKLHATIGRLKVENDFLEKALKKYQ